MTVAELIAELKRFPADKEVEVMAYYDNICAAGGPIENVALNESEGTVVIYGE